MRQSTRVLVAGASGKTGRELLQELRGRDVTIRALTRSPEKTDVLRELGADEVVVGDLLSARDAARAVEDADAVLCAVGSKPGRDWLSRKLVDGAGIVTLVDAAANEGISRFVMESAIGVGDSAERFPKPFRYLLFRTLRAKERAERYLRYSGLDYTIFRPGRLTNDPPTGDVVVAEGGNTVWGKIPRADVARLMVAALSTPAARNRTLEVVSREGLKGEAAGTVKIDWYRKPVVAERA